LNGEICQFISHRLVRDGEAVGSMTKCQSLSDIVAIQSKWFQDAADHYLNELGKLMDVNSKFIGNMLGSIGDSAMQGPPKTQKSPTNTPAPVREQKVSEAVS